MSINSQFCNPATGLATQYCADVINAYGLPIDRFYQDPDFPTEHILNIMANVNKKCYDDDFKVVANKLNPNHYYPDFAHARHFLNVVYSHRSDVLPAQPMKDAVGLCIGGSMHSVVKRLESLKMASSLGSTLKRLYFIVRTEANAAEIQHLLRTCYADLDLKPIFKVVGDVKTDLIRKGLELLKEELVQENCLMFSDDSMVRRIGGICREILGNRINSLEVVSKAIKDYRKEMFLEERSKKVDPQLLPDFASLCPEPSAEATERCARLEFWYKAKDIREEALQWDKLQGKVLCS